MVVVTKPYHAHCTHCPRIASIWLLRPPAPGLTITCGVCHDQPEGEKQLYGHVASFQEEREWVKFACSQCAREREYSVYKSYPSAYRSPDFCRRCFLMKMGEDSALAEQHEQEYEDDLRARTLRVQNDLPINTGGCPPVALRPDTLTYRYNDALVTRYNYRFGGASSRPRPNGKNWSRSVYWQESSLITLEVGSVSLTRSCHEILIVERRRYDGELLLASEVPVDPDVVARLQPATPEPSALETASRDLIVAWDTQGLIADRIDALRAALGAQG